MNILLFAVNAIAPIIILIIVGYLLKQIGLFNEAFFKTSNKLVFKLALPVMLFFSVYNVNDLGQINWTVVGFALIMTFVLFILGYISTLFIKDNKQKGVIWQGFFRANTAIIGIPLAVALGGGKTLAVVSVLCAFCVTAFNVLSVIALTVYTNKDQKSSVWGIVKSVLTNPLFISILLGLAVLAIRSILPKNASGETCFTIKNNIPFVYSALEMISSMTTPFSLIVLGGLFNFSAVKGLKTQIAIGTVSRLVFAPIICLVTAYFLRNTLGFDAPEFAAIAAIFCPPAAVSGLAMAAEMNNDEQLAGQVVVWTTVFSMLTIFIIIVVLKHLALI